MRRRSRILLALLVFIPVFIYVSLSLLDRAGMDFEKFPGNVIMTFSVILAAAWMLILVPICIMRVVDWYSDHEPTRWWEKVSRNLLRVPIGLFGLIAVVLGVAGVGWIAYNVVIERKPEFEESGGNVCTGLFAGLPLFIGMAGFGLYLIALSFERTPKRDEQTGEDGPSRGSDMAE